MTTVAEPVITEAEIERLEQTMLNTKALVMLYCDFLNKNPTLKQRHFWLKRFGSPEDQSNDTDTKTRPHYV